ncbi:hypothetical protein GCM10027030_05210 [Luteococcus sediminum]
MADAPRLDKPAEWTGHWWLPEDPQRAVPGVLRYEPGAGLTLSLIGGFEDRILQPLEGGYAVMEGSRSWPLVLGTADNKEITLLDCYPQHTQSYWPGPDGPHKQTISALTALVGVHLEDAEQEVFTESRVSVENLTLWAASSVFTQSLGLDGERLDGRGTLAVKPVDEPSVVVDGTTITLAHEHTLPHFDDQRGETVGRMRDTVFVRFRPGAPYSLSAAREQAKVVQDLVSLATHRAAGMLWLRLRMPPEDRDYPEGYPIQDRDVAVYSNVTVLGDPDAKAVAHHEVLFTCRDLPFEEVMPRWIEVRRTHQAAANMVLGLRYAPARYVEGNLLTAVGAAEVLHRALPVEQMRMPKQEFDALRATLLEAAPEEHRSWVKGAIRNDPTLRERLQALAALPDGEAMGRLVPDVEQWAKVATQARNDLAHTGQTSRQSIDELIAVVKVTAAVVMMNLLHALGLPGERQKEIVNDHPELRQTAKQAGEVLNSQPTDDGESV